MSTSRLVLLVCVSGCGSLADGSYLGEPLLSLHGTVITDGLDESFDDEPIGVAMLWTVNFAEGSDSQAAVVRTEFPARYTLDIYHPPPSGERIRLFGDDSFRGVIGMPVIFADSDQNGEWDRGSEDVIGGSYTTAVLYSEEMPAWFAEEAGEAAQYGFAPVTVDRDPCEEEEAEPGAALALDAGDQADLYVGYIWPSLWDWDCDGRDDEWNADQWQDNETCPNADVITHECNDFQTNLGQADPNFAQMMAVLLEDPFWTECLRQECPDTIATIEAGG